MKYLVVCIGNRDGGDDAVGPYIAEQLMKRIEMDSLDMEVLDVGVAPENYSGVIKDKNPEVLVLVDAVDMQMKPGMIRALPPESISVMHVSTHGIPLSVYIKYLQQYISKIILIGVQPEKMDGVMGDNVKYAADGLIDLIVQEKIFEIETLET